MFNPLAKESLGRSIVEALLAPPLLPLNDVEVFVGAGIYAIYYCGDFPNYAGLSSLNQVAATYPIYVGKAVPKGGRKGASADASLDSMALSKRLREHKGSIDSVDSLSVADFNYRYLVLDDIWISLGEALVIQRFQPLWNQVIEGFGNHDPGAGRYTGMRPLWDELHPGRDWAKRCKPPKLSKEQICAQVEAYMAKLTASVRCE